MTARDGKDILRVHDDEPKSRCFVHCVANSLERRLWFHANGSGRSFTKRYKIDRLVYYEDISSRVSKTWDICLDIVRDRTLWRLAGQHSKEFIAFLKSFKAMRNGFRTGTFRYGVLVVEKP